jgi:hypothetical protein
VTLQCCMAVECDVCAVVGMNIVTSWCCMAVECDVCVLWWEQSDISEQIMPTS